MPKRAIIIFLVFFISLMPAAECLAAQARNPATVQKGKNYAREGQTIKCEYFTVTIPAGWVMPEAIRRKPPVLYAAFADKKSGIAITYNILNIPMSAKELAEITIKNMNASGLKTSQLKKSGNFYRLNITGKVSGEAWFASNGKICTATIVLGEKMNKKVPDVFMKAFNPVDKGLFPTSM